MTPRPQDLDPKTCKTKDIQTLARAGFGWDLAREIIEGDGDTEGLG